MTLSTVSLCNLIVFGLILAAAPAMAQDEPERPAPNSLPIPSQEENETADGSGVALSEEEAKKIGFVRFFDFRSESENQPIAVFLSDGELDKDSSETNLLPLIRGSISPEFRDHIQFEAGTYQLLTRRETVTDFTSEDPKKLVPDYSAGQEIVAIEPVEIKAGEFQTIVIWGDAASPRLNIHVDQKFTEPRMLDVWNFLADQPFAITGNVNGEVKELAKSGPLGLEQQPLPTGTITPIELIYERKTGTVARLPVEVDVDASQSIILLAFRDRYGRVAFRGFPGAPNVAISPESDSN